MKLSHSLISPVALGAAFGVGFLTTLIMKRPRLIASVQSKSGQVIQRMRSGIRFVLKAYALWTALRRRNAVIDRSI